MPVINFLSHHGRGFGGSLKLRTVDRQLVLLDAVTGYWPRSSRRDVSNVNLFDGCMSRRRNPVDVDAFVHDRVVVHHIIIDDSGVVIDLRHLRWWQAVTSIIMLVEISHGDKREMVGVQPKVEAHANMHSVKPPANTGNKL